MISETERYLKESLDRQDKEAYALLKPLLDVLKSKVIVCMPGLTNDLPIVSTRLNLFQGKVFSFEKNLADAKEALANSDQYDLILLPYAEEYRELANQYPDGYYLLGLSHAAVRLSESINDETKELLHRTLEDVCLLKDPKIRKVMAQPGRTLTDLLKLIKRTS